MRFEVLTVKGTASRMVDRVLQQMLTEIRSKKLLCLLGLLFSNISEFQPEYTAQLPGIFQFLDSETICISG
jgi:hypothetical protein